jgi:Subtilase family
MSGKIITEGDRLLRADIARDTFKVDGSGIKVGIISNSFDAKGLLANDIANGELPGANNPEGKFQLVRVLKDLKSDNIFADEEGRALAQIVHDEAPGAEIIFHTSIADSGGVDDRSYSEAVNALVSAGANIIVEDVVVPTSIFQDGEAAQSVKNAVDKGVTVISAAGNNGRISYESDYRSGDTTFNIGGKTFEAFDFDPSKNVDLFQNITVTRDNTAIAPLLTWSDPNGKVSSDLELFLVSSPTLPDEKAENLLAVSGIPSETAIDDPLRNLSFPTTENQNLYLVIGRELNGTEAPRKVKWISTANGLDRTTKYEYINSNPLETGSSTISGQANLAETIAVGAADQNQDFTSGQAIARGYSSEGSSPILFNDVGDPLYNYQETTKSDLIDRCGIFNSDDEDDILLNLQKGIKPYITTPDGKANIRGYSSEGSSPILFNDVGEPLYNHQQTNKSDPITCCGIFNSDDEDDILLNPQRRVKPDIIAPDGIATSVAGFETFSGTSASAPGIAGVVALVQQAAGGPNILTPQQIKEILQDTSVPVNLASGMANPFPGVGLPQADLAVAQAQLVSGDIRYDNDLCNFVSC